MRDRIDFTKIYSFSRLDAFEQCPKRYYFNYLDPEVAPRKKEFIKPRDYKTKGQAIHGAITLFYHLPVKERTFENLKKGLLHAWYSDQNPFIAPPLGEWGGFKDIEHERKIYSASLSMLKKFYAMKDIDPPLFYMPTENIKESFDDYKSMIQPIDNGHQISGKFDRIDKMENGNLRIIDFKTSKEEIEGHFQLEFYKLLAEMKFKTKVDMVSFYYFGPGIVKNFDFKNVDSETIKNKILEKINTIENCKDFKMKKTFLCSHCDFKEICPAFQKAPNVIQLS